MQKLTNKEEEIMQILWKLEKAFIKDILAEISNDKPHYNTLSTIVRNLEDKGYVSYTAYGKTHQYFPIIKFIENAFLTQLSITILIVLTKTWCRFLPKKKKLA